jgi:hypothetical protein|tara:strand:+ start:43 stop:699 length:657 start_codon:yes stop_codon:yes gene_type:complete
MANTSFTGAVRSENGFTKISKAAGTGVITEGSTYSDAASITGVTSATGGLVIGAADSLKLIAVTATTGTLAVTDDTNTIVTIAQPAGTILKDLIAYPAGNIVTGGSSGNDLDIFIGTASAGAQLLAATALLDDGGAAVTWTANVPLYIIENSHGQAANAFATAGIGPKGGPATSEAIVIAAALYSAAARDIFVTLRPIGADLATAATTVKYIAVFQYL